MTKDIVTRAKESAVNLANLIHEMSDSELIELVDTGTFNNLLKAVLDPSLAQNHPTIAEFFLKQKTRLTFLALLRHEITQSYSFEGKNSEGKIGYASPVHFQYFNDGVMFTEGEHRFEGIIGVYRNGKASYAIAARDARVGEKLGPENFRFVDIDGFSEILKRMTPKSVTKLEEPVEGLRNLLSLHNNDESDYQNLLMTYPWVLGAQYKEIQRHENLDDKNIPDFTGIRIDGHGRDIFEMKPPFLKLFLENGDFSADFNKAWNQAERYLSFVREEKDYLRRKGFLFDHSKCYLILGYDLTNDEIGKIRIKQRLNPSIEVLTYNDLLAFMEATANLVEKLKIENPIKKGCS